MWSVFSSPSDATAAAAAAAFFSLLEGPFFSFSLIAGWGGYMDVPMNLPVGCTRKSRQTASRPANIHTDADRDHKGRMAG